MSSGRVGLRKRSSRSPALILLIHLSSLVLQSFSDPLTRSFTSCLSQHASTLAPPEQLITFNQLWTQIDTGQSFSGQLGDLRPGSLRATIVGNVTSQGSGYSSQTNFLATLITQTSVLNFQSFFNQSALCSSIRSPGFSSSRAAPNSSAPNSGCPYGPGDVALGVSIPINSGYPFTTLTTQLRVLDTSTPALTIACVQFDATPYYPDLLSYELLFWVPAGVALGYLLICWTGRVWATIISAQLDREAQLASSLSEAFVGSSSWTSRFATVWWRTWSGHGLLLSGALLRFATPGVSDFIAHLQFVTSLGFFAVEWPEFVYPILSKASWSSLVVNSTIIETKGLDDSNLRPNPLLTPQYSPPQSFVNQFDSPDSPLYLNRALPNNLLNLNTTTLGIPRWATVVGLHSRDIFGVSLTIFFSICGAIVVLSLVAYLVDLTVCLINRSSGRDGVAHSDKRGSNTSNSHRAEDLDESSGSYGLTRVTPEGDNNSDPASWWQIKRVSGGSGDKSTRLGEKVSAAKSAQASSSPTVWPEWKLHLALLQGNLLRAFIMFYFPLVIFSSHQLTLIHTASSLSIGIAGLILLLCALIPIVQVFRLKRQATDDLIDNQTVALSLGPMYTTFADRSEMFMGVRFGCALMIGIVVGAGQSTGITQAVVLLLAELVEIMLTSLSVPWGEGAAMAPLAFVFSISRIITAVILVVLTPTVSVGSTAAGWLAYVVLGLQAFVIAIYLLVLTCKIVELALRLLAHIPFDETKSSRAGGLSGAIRRWDRTTSRSTRHGRAAAIAARRRRRHESKTIPSGTPRSTRKSSFFDKKTSPVSLGVSTAHRKDYGPHPQPYPSPTPSVGFSGFNDDDGNIMSAMSQGPWLRTPGPESMANGFPRPRGYSNAALNTPHQLNNATQSPMTPDNLPSSGFAVVRGGRATEKAPYLMHDDGRRTWQNYPRTRQISNGARDYPPAAHQAQMQFGSSPDFSHHPSPSGNPFSGSSKTTTNLFENTALQPSSSDIDDQSHSYAKGKARKSKKPFMSLAFFKKQEDRNDASSDEDDWDDTDEEEEDNDERGGGPSTKIKDFVLGIGGWGRKRESTLTTGSDDSEPEPEITAATDTAPSGSGRTFEVVRQPRPKPTPTGTSSRPTETSKSSSTNLLEENIDISQQKNPENQ